MLAASKAPRLTPVFWAVSLLTVVGGGVTSDYLLLGSRLAGGAVEVVLLLAGLTWQLRTPRYTAPAFWFLSYATTIGATSACDTLDRAGLPYAGAVLAVDRFLGLQSITTFWLAFILLRPLGAAAADYLSKAPSASGLGFGDARTALVATLAFACLTIGTAKANS